MSESKISYQASSLRVCVDKLDIENRRMEGRIYSRWLPQPVSFGDLSRLVLGIEEALEKQGFPHAFQRKRTFPQNKRTSAEDECGCPMGDSVERESGTVSTLAVTVETRLNTTWQGRVDWQNDLPSVRFESALEFIRILDSHFFPENRFDK